MVGARGIEPLTPTMSRCRSDCPQRFDLSREIGMPVIYYPPFARVAVGNRSDFLDSADRSKCS
jgi:hypothetical protein